MLTNVASQNHEIKIVSELGTYKPEDIERQILDKLPKYPVKLNDNVSFDDINGVAVRVDRLDYTKAV